MDEEWVLESSWGGKWEERDIADEVVFGMERSRREGDCVG